MFTVWPPTADELDTSGSADLWSMDAIARYHISFGILSVPLHVGLLVWGTCCHGHCPGRRRGANSMIHAEDERDTDTDSFDDVPLLDDLFYPSDMAVINAEEEEEEDLTEFFQSTRQPKKQIEPTATLLADRMTTMMNPAFERRSANHNQAVHPHDSALSP